MRATASWAAVLAWTGFHYSAVTRRIGFAARAGRWFWSTGESWGACVVERRRNAFDVAFTVMQGTVVFEEFALAGFGTARWSEARTLGRGTRSDFHVSRG